MASEARLSKHRRYDPSMSKRTRKPQVVEKASLNQDDELPKDCNSINGSSMMSSLNQDDELPKDCNSINGSSMMSSLNQDDELVKGSSGVHQLSLSSLHHDDELQEDSDDIHHSSLKELMNEGNGQGRVASTEAEVGGEVGGEMKEAVTTSVDKSILALVPKQGEGITGVKTGGMVSRYVKVLSHLIKVKRGSKKKSVVPLLKP